MGILGHLLGFGSPALAGSLFGLLGNITAKAFTYLDQRQSLTQKQAEWTHETELLRLRQRSPLPETESEISIAATQGAWSGLAASIAADAAIGASYPWVNALRALVRPALTLGLTGFLAFACLAPLLTQGQRAGVIDNLVFAGVTAIVWWFGDRAPGRPRRK